MILNDGVSVSATMSKKLIKVQGSIEKSIQLCKYHSCKIKKTDRIVQRQCKLILPANLTAEDCSVEGLPAEDCSVEGLPAEDCLVGDCLAEDCLVGDCLVEVSECVKLYPKEVNSYRCKNS